MCAEKKGGISGIDVKLGDCFHLIKTIQPESVDCVLIDPPYGMSFQSNYRTTKYKKISNDENLQWLDMLIPELYRVMKMNTAVYCFCSWHNIDQFKIAFEKQFKIKNIIVWEKNNTSMGDLKGSYASKYEFVLFAHKGRRLLNGFRFADIIKENKTQNKYHPTEKPVALLEHFIRQSSNEGDVVLDCFMGSGSTAVACINTNRQFIGFELDEGYFQTAQQRILEEIQKRS